MQTEIKIQLSPLTVNKAWRGRRFKTKYYLQYEQDFLNLLLAYKYTCINGYVEVWYNLYLKNWKICDGGNFEKPISDIIVKAGIIQDDRFIKRYHIEKFPAEIDSIEIKVKSIKEV